jgi:hypothetical protein
MSLKCRQRFPGKERCLLDHLPPFGTSCSLSFKTMASIMRIRNTGKFLLGATCAAPDYDTVLNVFPGCVSFYACLGAEIYFQDSLARVYLAKTMSWKEICMQLKNVMSRICRKRLR